MKNNFIAAAVGVVALIGLTAASPATAGNSSAVGLEEMLPVLAEPRTDADGVPESVDLVALGNISEDSVRLLGNDHAGTYWVGTTSTDDVCLVMQTASDPDMAASTCAPIGAFYRNGLRLMAGKGMGQPTSNTQAYLFPADIRVPGAEALAPFTRSTSDVGPSGTFISGLLGELDGIDAFDVSREDGTTFQFVPILHEGM